MRAGAGMLALLMATGCTAAAADRDKEVAVVPAAAVGITPENGAQGLIPELPIMVSAAGGTLKDVTVEAKGKRVAGMFSADRTRWRSARPMTPGTDYTVTAVAVNAAGKTTETKSVFSTVKAAKSFDVQTILPNKELTGLTVGVGMPIMITFDRDVTDRVSIEKNLQVLASKPIQGAWHWFDNRRVTFRPKEYWPAHTKVRLVARLAGVRGADGMYGTKDYVRDFTIGRSQISYADTGTHHMKVKRDGKLVRNMPISAGKGGEMKYYTTSGVHLAMDRELVTVMTSPGIGPGSPGYYQTTVYDTVRISDTGEYVHGAPWSVGDQGNSNVSHGCVNVSPENAKWFMTNTLIGDPIVVTGSPRPLDPTNGWGHWQESWKQWLKWSRLRGASTEPL
ncbi:Ig-like domain-containing protein [Microtetraspora sp. AC03309]|uniref:L,D-transpeptidase n=1 Tax=Microtetraspora sp. AC03309 TaxID=2779376 RepID=UPI001E3EE82B|nr:Ig-like domain-containing protein [Microtetraspora sp. AC03309]